MRRARCAVGRRRAGDTASRMAPPCSGRGGGPAQRPGSDCSDRAEWLPRPREGEEARPRHRQERPDQPATRQFAHRRHAGQPVVTAAGAAPNEVGLDLILALVRGEKVEAAVPAAPLGHQPVARIASRFLNTARRLVAGPHDDFVGDGTGGEPTGQRPGFRGAFGPQPVVDGQRPGAAATPSRPFFCQQDKGQAIGAA